MATRDAIDIDQNWVNILDGVSTGANLWMKVMGNKPIYLRDAAEGAAPTGAVSAVIWEPGERVNLTKTAGQTTWARAQNGETTQIVLNDAT